MPCLGTEKAERKADAYGWLGKNDVSDFWRIFRLIGGAAEEKKIIPLFIREVVH